MRGFNYKKAVQALNYFASQNDGTLNKMKAIKLIWLADRLHLRQYGRTITGDEYYALPNGPVPSATRDVLEVNQFLDDVASEYATQYIKSTGQYYFKSINTPNLKVFSQTDLNALDTIVTHFGHLSQYNLSDLSHYFPEWKKYESALEKKLASRFSINQEDFFININEKSGLFMDSEDSIKLSKEVFDENSQLQSVL